MDEQQRDGARVGGRLARCSSSAFRRDLTVARARAGRGRIWYRHRLVVGGFDPHRLYFEPGCCLRIRVGIATFACLVTFEIAGPRIDSPPEVIANGENVGPASLVIPGLADPGYRGEMHAIVSQMQFQYTGWLRAQKIVPVSALRTGTNNITIINGPNAAGAVIRATQIQLKYLWDKSDYILKPDR